MARWTRAASVALVAALGLCSAAAGQEPKAAAAEEAKEAPAWEYSFSTYAYFVPDGGKDYASSTLNADKDWMHLEGRWNYEALGAASVWLGATFTFGETVTFEVTPMLGGVFGSRTGVAPGYHLTVNYKNLELYSEGEYYFDTAHRLRKSVDYFYTWSELAYSPGDWLRAGLVAQRTRAYKTSLDIQRGFFVGTSVKPWTLTVYVFNAGWTDPTVVAALAFEF